MMLQKVNPSDIGTTTLPDRADAKGTDDALLAIIIGILVLFGIGCKGHLLTQLPINQDEFEYLSYVHAYDRGELTRTIQNMHVHFFGWLDVFSNNEVTQVIVARSVMFLFFLGTCTYLFLLGRYFLNLPGAMFSVLCYLCFVFTIGNGATFRSDTVATFLFMLAVYHFVAKEKSLICGVVAGVVMALAFLFTIKTSIYLMLFVALSLLRLKVSRDLPKSLKQTACFWIALILGLCVFYALHAATFPRSSSGSQAGFLSYTPLARYITFKRPFLLRFLLMTFRHDLLLWFVLLVGVGAFFYDTLTTNGLRGRSAYLPAMLVPLLSLLVYRNTYPYFYVFILPPPSLFCGYSLHRTILTRSWTRQRLGVILGVVLAVLVFLHGFVFYCAFFPRFKTTAVQHNLLSEIHKMFPDPVPYVGGCSMVASFPKVGFYMCSPRMDRYLERGVPIMERLLTQEKPIFLLADVPHLDLHCDIPTRSAYGQSLMEEDWAALKSYFVHYWGPIWVVGKRFDFKAEEDSRSFEISVPGAYAVEGGADILIDGTLYQSGDVVHLEEGIHSIQTNTSGVTITLRWDDNLYRPNSEPSTTNLFLGPLL
ncbi:MAG: ArnT family glycosyltransferase [Planctomycetota bacterium]|jgi:hypothetical protein